jgi:hypothetical protein
MTNLKNKISDIHNEIIFLNKYKNNLKKFFFIQTKSGTIRMIDFTRFLDEINRINLEINYLEKIKSTAIKKEERR